VAEWLVQQGARYLVLVGRSQPNESAMTQIKAQEEQGVTIKIAQADVSELTEIKAVLIEQQTTMPPLRGIIHAAGVLADGVLVQQDWAHFQKVMAPKITGAWHLHQLTRHQSLDYFILFSSAASLLGSPGQANHAAANAFLDGLAHFRQAQGLPALSINWGAWLEIGAAANQHVMDRVKSKGMASMKPEDGLQALAQLLAQPAPQVGVVPIHWPRFLQAFPGAKVPPFLAEFLNTETPNIVTDSSAANLQSSQLQTAITPEASQTEISTYLQTQVAHVLRLKSTEVDKQQPLNRIGVDSLMAVELRNRVRNHLNIDVPIVTFLEGITIEQLATQITKDNKTTATPSLNLEEPDELLAHLDQLSDEEVEALLSSEAM
jgi:short-subunit dehydrogenase/acyl carrier protein